MTMPPVQLYRTSFRAMACVCEIAVDVAAGEALAKQAMQQAAREVARIERKYSRYRNDGESIIHRINMAAGTGEPVICDAETIGLFRWAAKLHEMSGGLFDITSGVLRRAWNFAEARVPRAGELEPLLALIDFRRIEISGDSVDLPLTGMEVDFGGFGKEYAADRAAEILAKHGIASGYVNLGGDIRAVGSQPGGAPWRFGVSDPRQKGSILAHVNISRGGLATSGDYEKFFELDGVRYCHILNPRTGFPVQCWRSVSVSAISTLSAGALTTIAMLKQDDAVPFLDQMKCGYLLVDATGRVVSNGPS